MRNRKLNQRPPQFRLDNGHPLAGGLLFAALGRSPGSTTLINSTPAGNAVLVGSADTKFSNTIGRFTTLLGGGTNYYNAGTSSRYYAARWSVSSWVYITEAAPAGQSNVECIVGRSRNTPAARTYSIDIDTKTPRSYFTSGATYYGVDADNELTLSRWTHLAATYNQSSLRLYQDGVLIKSASYSHVPDDNSEAQLHIGNYGESFTNGLKGELADAMVWDRALSDAEILVLSDPSNVMLSGLVVQPRRTLFAIPAPIGFPQSITVTVASATASAVEPFVLSETDVVMTVATATATAHEPAIVSTWRIETGVCSATASAIAPTVDAVCSVTMPVAIATATAHEPNMSEEQLITVDACVATATAIAPRTRISVMVGACIATASAVAPTVTAITSLTMPIALAMATAHKPNITGGIPSGSSSKNTRNRFLEYGA